MAVWVLNDEVKFIDRLSFGGFAEVLDIVNKTQFDVDIVHGNDRIEFRLVSTL